MNNFCTFIGVHSKHVLHVVFSDAAEACSNSGHVVNSVGTTLSPVSGGYVSFGCSGDSKSYASTECLRT